MSELSRFVAAPADSHAKTLRHLLRYLKGTVTLGLVYSARAGGAFFGALNQLVAYVDSDWAGDPETRRSTTGFVILLNGTAISWKSKRQSVIALSSAEAELVAASSLVQEVTYCFLGGPWFSTDRLDPGV